MNETWKELYRRLCADTDEIKARQPCDAAQTEKLFNVCLGYWQQCKAVIPAAGFATEAAEIDFFKRIKPPFTAQLEYYVLVYQHQQFCPFGDVAEVAAFNDNESRKIDRFQTTHTYFIRYYMDGRTDQDATWFLRRSWLEDAMTNTRPYDADPSFLTAGDWILAQWLGYEAYAQFLSGGWVGSNIPRP